MKFLVDTQLSPKLARYLVALGHDCIHTVSCPNGYFTTDRDILSIATVEDRIVITKDSDFRDHYLSKGSPPNVLYLTFGNISNDELFTYFNKYFNAIVDL